MVQDETPPADPGEKGKPQIKPCRGTLKATDRSDFRKQTVSYKLVESEKRSTLLRMSNPFRLLLLWLLSLAVAMAASQTGEQKPANLPQITAYNLEKTKVSLPADFSSSLNLVILFFDQDQYKNAESWIPANAQITTPKQDLHYYLLPIFSRQNFLYRWWMNSSMRSSTQDTSRWKWTVPLYLNKQRFMQKMDIHSDHEITVLLVDKTGKILWRDAGPFMPEKKASLENAINASISVH